MREQKKDHENRAFSEPTTLQPRSNSTQIDIEYIKSKFSRAVVLV